MKPQFVKFIINHQTRKLLIDDDKLITPNQQLIPHKFLKLCIDYQKTGLTKDNASNYIYPYINIDAFDLFINLIYTPIGCKISNPKLLTSTDLQSVLHAFTDLYKEDSFIVEQLIKRLNSALKKSRSR